MKKIIYLLAMLTLVYFIAGCGAAAKFQEPTEDGILLIGSIIVENNGINETFETITKFIEVAVMGLNTVEGETKLRGYWAETDADGYYYLCNLPRGKYVLKGLKVWIAGSTQGVISSKLEGEGSPYYWHRRQDGQSIIFEGEYFAPEPEGRVYNLNHWTFSIYPNRTITPRQFYSMDNQKLVLDKTYTRPNVIEYFRTKFAGTGWEPILNEPYRTKGEKRR